MSASGEASPLKPSAKSACELQVRWRGKQEGPFSPEIIEKKLSSGEIGLLHEVFFAGKWQTLRDYLGAQQVRRQTELFARQQADQLAHEEETRAAREREESTRAAALAEEKRKNDLLEQVIKEQPFQASLNRSVALVPVRPHRGGTILAFSLIGLLIFFPFSIAAWRMGSGDLAEMNAGIMDSSGYSLTRSGRTIGLVGTLLWCAGLLFWLFCHDFRAMK